MALRGPQFMAHTGQELALELVACSTSGVAKLQLRLAKARLVYEFGFFSFVMFLLSDVNGNNDFSRATGKFSG